MAAEKLEHMVEKADPGGDPAGAGAVEVDRNRDLGLGGLTLYAGLTHGVLSVPGGFLAGAT